jgi:hypothetical protein
MSSSARAALSVVCAAALFAACDPIDGGDPYALWRAYEHPDGAFHFHALSPPWEDATESIAEHPVLVLDPSNASNEQDAGIVPGARARLEAFLADSSDIAAEASERRDLWQAAGYEVEDAVEFVNRAGDEGLAVRGVNEHLHFAEVLFLSDEGVALLSLWGTAPFDDDFALLMESFEPRASGDHE